jgi:SET domain-containing protein
MNLEKLLYDFIEVRDSDIEGKGLFSLLELPLDTKIMVIEGEVIDEEECLKREYEENNVYIFWNDFNYIDTANSSKLKYLNHSCNPNCYVASRNSESLYLVSAKNISAGEELTIDYGYEEIYENCKCNYCKNK